MTVTPSSRLAFAVNIASTFGAKIAAAVLGILVAAIVARTLGPEGRGSLAAVMALAGIGTQFANLGLHSSNTYFLARDRGLLTTIVANSILVSVVCGAIAATALGAIAWWTGVAQSAGFGLFALALLSIPLGLAYLLLVNLLVALSSVGRFNQIEIGLKIATLGLTLAAVAIHATGAMSFLAAAMTAQFIALAAVWLSLGQKLSGLKASSIGLLRQQVPFAFRSYLSAFLAFLLLRVDVLMVQRLSGNAEAGFYSIAVAMADLIYMLPAAAGMLLFPRLSVTADGNSRRRATWKLLLVIGLAMSGMGLVAALLAAPAISLVFGPSYLPAAPMFYVLVVAIVAYGMNNIVSNHLAAEGLPWIGVWVWGVGLAVNVALNLLWIPNLGGRGAALASAVAYAIVLAIQCLAIFGTRGKTK